MLTHLNIAEVQTIDSGTGRSSRKPSTIRHSLEDR